MQQGEVILRRDNHLCIWDVLSRARNLLKRSCRCFLSISFLYSWLGWCDFGSVKERYTRLAQRMPTPIKIQSRCNTGNKCLAWHFDSQGYFGYSTGCRVMQQGEVILRRDNHLCIWDVLSRARNLLKRSCRCFLSISFLYSWLGWCDFGSVKERYTRLAQRMPTPIKIQSRCNTGNKIV